MKAQAETKTIEGLALRLCDALPEVVLLVDGDGTVLMANRHTARLLGRPAGEVVGRPLLDFIAGDPTPVLAYLARCARTGEPLPGTLPFATASGTDLRQAQGAAVRADDGSMLIFLRCVERRQASRLFVELNARLARLTDELYRRGRLQAKLQQALNEREVLLREVHHRVRNNLQVITSFLNLQLRGVHSEVPRQALLEAQTRIRALGLVHGQLYDQENLAEIDFARLIPELCGQLAVIYGTPEERVRFAIALPPWRLDLNRGVALALLVTEVVTNALKYAFPDERPGTITIELQGHNGARALRIADNGVGLPKEALGGRKRSLGWQLMHALAGQLDAQLDIRSGDGGVEVRIVLAAHG